MSLLIRETTLGAGSTDKDGSIQTDAVAVTLWVDSIASGSLSVTVFTLTDTGKEIELLSFPTVTAPSTTLLLRKSGVSLQRFRVVATYTGVCTYEIYARAVDSAGETSTKLLGSGSLATSAATVTTSVAPLIPASLTDRNGLTVKNNGTFTIELSEDSGKLPGQGWPISPGETWSLDVAGGVTIYAVSLGAGSVDVRVAESGQ